MAHDPMTCKTCLRSDRIKYDEASGLHFVPRDGDLTFPLFRLYPIVPEPA